MNFPDKLKQYQVVTGKIDIAIAREFGVSQSMIQRYLLGKSTPKFALAKKIVSIIPGLTMGDFGYE